MTTRSAQGLLAVLLATATSCAPLSAPGMTESATPLSADTAAASTLRVAFPVSACTATESLVFFDEQGRFIGSVAPGTAADLVVPLGSGHVFAVGSYDVTAPPKTWFVRNEVSMRTDQGVLVEVDRADSRNCRSRWPGPRPRETTLAVVAEAAQGLRPLVSEPSKGNQWLDEHRERVNELLGRAPAGEAPLEPVVTQVQQPQ